MKVGRKKRDQYRWAGCAALLLALLFFGGCGADGRGAGDRDGEAYPEPGLQLTDDALSGPATVATREESGDLDAAHSAAWMEALDGLAVVRGDADDGGRGDASVEAEAVTPEPVYVAPPPTAPSAYANLDTSAQLSEAQMVDLLRQAGFDEYTWPFMLRIAWCESKFSPNATGAAGEVGLFQVHPRWHPDAVYDPLGNAKAAYRISAGGYDYSAWSCRP